MRTADLAFDELYVYDYSDKQIEKMRERMVEIFADCKTRIRSTFYDPKKAIAYSRRMYSRLWADCKRTLLKVAKHYWKECDDMWLWLFLTEYDPVFKVVYANEYDRKQARFVESVLACDTVGNKAAEMDRAMRLWSRMISEMGIEVTDRAMLDNYRAKGVKYVVWLTEHDEKVCLECADMNGKVYPIDKVPPKPHINCRCRLMPYRGQGRP